MDSSVTQATVSATANDAAATVAFAPQDADANVEGHQVDLSAGRNVVRVTVTAEDGFTKRYTVSINRGVTDVGGWQAGADLDGLIAAGIDDPQGIWSDGTTVWVADTEDDKLYAYNLSDRMRDDARDISLGAGNGDPGGIWSDGTIIWVADGSDQELYAYNLSDGMRDDGRDITLDTSNDAPFGIWSDGTTMWVVDQRKFKRFAYNLSDGGRDLSRDKALARDIFLNGIWSDRTTMWVANSTDDKLFASRLSDGVREDGRDITLATNNNDPRGIWSDGTTMWVGDWLDKKLYAYIMPLTGDARLSELSVSPKDIVSFDGDRRSYEVGVDSSVTRATVSATANDDAARVAFAPQDADANVEGHQVDLSAGRNVVRVTVTAEEGFTQDYTVRVNRGVTDATGWQAGADLDGLIAAGNSDPYGIWSDGTTVWVGDQTDDKLYAYRLSDGTRDDGRDINLPNVNDGPSGIWSDGTTIWVADIARSKLYAYRQSDGTRDDGLDIDTLLAAGNTVPEGIWSDGTTIWVANWLDSNVYAYRLSDGLRESGRDITLTARNTVPWGIWSDATTMWGGGHGVPRGLLLPAVRRGAGRRPGLRPLLAGCVRC